MPNDAKSYFRKEKLITLDDTNEQKKKSNLLYTESKKLLHNQVGFHNYFKNNLTLLKYLWSHIQ